MAEDDTQQSGSMTPEEADAEKKSQKEHPELWEGNIYCGTDEEAHKKAKETLAAQKKAAEQGKDPNAASPPADPNANQNGNSYYTEDDLIKAIGPVAAASILGSNAEARKRQHILNYDNYATEYKHPNPNNIVNNQDAYPVDQKIEELETHWPNVKLYEVTVDKKALEAAVAAMRAADAAEKRIVKLENMISTLHRLFFRLGTRVAINCVYYGGQTPFEKYKGIRCLRNDRISDGQEVQIDQCLYCTRFEPIFGQCYEILNDTGSNVTAILDDNQMGYQKIDEFVKDARIEKYHDSKTREKAEIPATEDAITTRANDEHDFVDFWGQGLAMDWTYVPKEQQKTHINWRQSIRDDGSKLGRLASWPYLYDRPNLTGQASSSQQKIMERNKAAMDAYPGNDPEVKAAIGSGVSLANNSADDMKNLINTDYQKPAKEAFKKSSDKMAGGDWLMLACMAYVRKAKPEQLPDICNEYSSMSKAISTQNPALVMSAMATGKESVIGGGKAKPLEEVTIIKKVGDGGSSKGGETDPKPGSGDDKDPNKNKLDKKKRNSWLWADFAEYYITNAASLGKTTEEASFFPKVCYAYCVLYPDLMPSGYSHDGFVFPFTDEQLATGGIYYTSPYGWRESTNSFHHGIDIGADEGIEFHAVHDGTVTAAGGGWGSACNALNIQHNDDKTYSRYLHCSAILVTVGQKVKAGDIIGKVGGYGGYDPHLHLEISSGQAEVTQSDTDPLSFFPGFNTSKDQPIKPFSDLNS